jgi:integrase
MHDKLIGELWKADQPCNESDHTWEEAVVMWLKEKSHKASLEKDRSVLRWVDPYLSGKRLREINRELLVRIADIKSEQSTPATANRDMAVIRAILRRACNEWEWIERVPKVPMFYVRGKRVSWITREKAEELIGYLPPHQAAMARFALTTGLRQRNVKRLKWADVDMQRRCCWIHSDEAKARRAIGVPLNAEALAILAGLIGQHDEFVFTFEGQPVTQVNTKSWRKAVSKAGLQDFRWHDLRHTWASWHVQAGTPLNVLQEMGGWATADMVRRYAHLSAAHLADFAERIVPKYPVFPGTAADQKVVGLRKALI